MKRILMGLVALFTMTFGAVAGEPLVYGPFGTEEDVVIDKVEPTIFAGVSLMFGETAAVADDCVAVYRKSNDRLCGLGKVIVYRGQPQLTLSMQVTGGTEVYFKGWQKTSGEVKNLQASLNGVTAASTILMPQSGSVDSVLVLTAATAQPIQPTPVYEGDFRADPEDVAIDKVEPTIFSGVTLAFGGASMAVGDKVALYRVSDDVLCGYGEVVLHKGAAQLTLSMQVKEGTVVRFEGWQASSRKAYALRVTLGDVKDAVVLAMPEPGSVVSGLSLATALDPVAAADDDLNGDGRADIVMTIYEKGHGAEGATGAWLIKADQTAAWGDLSQRNPGWDILGTGVTKAGKATKDVYVISWENVVGAWVTDSSGKVTGWETVGSFDGETMVGGLGDFNGDGQSDLLLVNRNGAIGCQFTSGAKTGWNYFQSLGSEWQICGIGDLNGDGRDDLVLKHDAGFAGSWLTQADGTMAWADLDTLPAGFAIVGCGDFNGDGTDDVLLKRGNYYGAWIVRNGNAAGWMGLGDLGNVTVEQIADFDGDGRDDLRIRTEAGDIGTQLVKGADNLVWAYYGSVGSEWLTEPIGLK